MEAFDVAVVGAGPAGAAVATLLAGRGRSVVLIDRRAVWRWHACGVFAGPAVRPFLASLGFADLERAGLARTVPAMRLETPPGTVVRLSYGADGGGPPALAFDRAALDGALVRAAVAAGATPCLGTTVRAVGLDGAPVVRLADGAPLSARVVVGADGIRSVVARAAGVARVPRLRRFGFTFHVAEGRGTDEMSRPRPVDARMIVLDDAYCGLAPVPGGRVNVGIVRRPTAAPASQAISARAVWSGLRARIRDTDAAAVAVAADAAPLDAPAGASPIGHRVVRRAGRNWLLVGDAAGFIDPFTGEGLHRALASAFLAAEAIDRTLAGERAALRDYDRAMRSRFATKDAVSLVVQAFLARPAAFEYAATRLARRPHVLRTLEAVLGDLAPASRALDPRFLASLLAP